MSQNDLYHMAEVMYGSSGWCYNPTPFFLLPDSMPLIGTPVQSTTPIPPVIFPSATPPELMGKAPLPLNPPSLSPLEDMPPKPEWTRPATPQWTSPSQVVMTQPSSPVMSIYPSFDLPPVPPPIPIPWSTYCQEHSSMEYFTEPPSVEHPQEDLDSPMKDKPTVHYLLDSPEGNTHALSPKESPVKPWREYLTQPNSPVSRKHFLSPTSPFSVPIHQCTSREGSYQSIMPTALSPLVGTSPQSQGNQTGSSEGSADTSSSTQSSADDTDNDLALNWVSIRADYHKG